MKLKKIKKIGFRRVHIFCSLVMTLPVLNFAVTAPILAQSIAGSTPAKLGNATAFPNSNFINNPLSAIDPGVSSTRHAKRAIGSTGIGGSTVGTENITSESAPATQPLYNPVIRTPAISQTSNYSYYSQSQRSPALNSVMNTNNFGFNASSISSFNSDFSSNQSNTGLDVIPSFNRNSIIQGYSHGERSWNGP